MTTHIRTDNGPNASRTFECGIGPALLEGDKKVRIELDGRNGGNVAWRAFSASWEYP